MPAEVAVCVVGPDDWADWRALRLDALQDTPIAFCQRYDEALALDEPDWRARLRRPGVNLLLRRDGRAVAMGCGFVDPHGGPTLASVYVTPSARGRGLLDALVDEVERWGAGPLRLEVHEDNAPARAAYARLGFVETGARRPYPLGPGDELEMVRRRVTAR